MNILLINNNPVVSRLLSLCMRDQSIVFEEVKEIEESKRDSYDIVFVDEAVYKGKTKKLNKHLSIEKKVLFTHTDMLVSDFDIAIEKPFLPSQVLDILESFNDKSGELKKDKILSTQVLDGNEVGKIKELLEINEIDQDISDEVLSDEEYEARKIKAIKEQLITEGLEIVEEKELLEDLDVDDDSNTWKFSKEENLFLTKVKRKKMKNKASNKKQQKLAHKEDDLIVQALEMAIRTLTKKQRKKLLKGKEVEISIKLEGKV